ncbi:MAG: PAS domain S-box protein [Clostridia bacterium]|jgi:PAS domain S-box-containing protein|nr:PAS domain S-box protein [Clostridia bacterium]
MENKKINYLTLHKQIASVLSNIDNTEAKLQHCRKSLEHLKDNSVNLNNLLVEEKRRWEEAEEKKLLRFFLLSLDILLIVDFEGNFQHVNPAFTTILGYHQDHFVGFTWLELVARYVHPDDREATLQTIKEAVSGKPLYSFENRCLCQNGSYKWLIWSVMPSVEEGLLYAVAKDITDQKGTQQQVRESSEFFHRAINSLNEGIAIFAAARNNAGEIIDFNFEYINEAGCSFLGIGKTEDIVGKGLLEMFPGNQTNELFAKYCRVMETGQPATFESFSYHQEELNWVLDVRASKFGNAIVVSWRDITQRKLREEALIQEREKEVEFLECITEPFLGLDVNWNFTYINKSAEKYLGKNRHELLGKNFGEGFSGAVDTLLYNNLRQVYANKVPLSFEVEAMLLGKDFEVHVFPLKEGVSVFAKNITARKRMEKALKQSGGRFATVFHASPAMLAILSLEEKRFLDVNKCWEKYTGYSRAEVIGKTIDIFDLSGDEATKETRNKVITGQLVMNHPVKYRTKAGEIREALFSAEIIHIYQKPCLLSVSLDVTEKNHLEEKIAHLNRLELIGQMAAGISHEIRNPMTTVRGFLQLMSGREKFQEEKANFDLMISELDGANQIITDFLSLSKTKPKELKLQDLNLILEKLHPPLAVEAFHQNKYLAIKTGQLPLIYLDEKEIRQLVLNLCKNGLEAMLAETTIVISTFVEGNNVVLTVKDEGHGMDENGLAKIGTPFFTTKDHGIGLGIAVCQSIAVRHNGKIEYESDSLGTMVRVLFPIPMADSI